MSGFKVGDRVRCVRAGLTGGALKVGAVYTVRDVNDVAGTIRLTPGDGCAWGVHRFELVPPTPPRDLNPFEWDYDAEYELNEHRTNLPHRERVVAFARWLWAVTGLPFTFGDTPDTVTVELPRKDAEFFARHEFTSRPNAVVSTACRAALDGES